MSLIAQKLESILDSSAVVPWEAIELDLKAQIGRAAPKAAIECVVYPATPEELAEVVTCANQHQWRMLLCGSGSKLHWGGVAAGVQLVVGTAKLNRLIDHASSDMTVTAEAGLRFADLQTTLNTTGQFLAVDPAYPDQTTLGGIVATADTGALRQRYGGVRDMLIGISFVRSDGKLAKAGGRVVKNVAGYDLMKLFTGSYGTLGILTQVTFRIYPLPPASQTVLLTGEASAIEQATATILASALTPTAITVLTPATVAALQLGRAMGLLVRFQSIDVSVVQQSKQLSQLGEQLGLRVLSIALSEEVDLWQRLREQIDPPPSEAAITCKIGVEPKRVVATVNQIHQLTAAVGVVHVGSGLGTVITEAASETLLNLRQLCQSHGGFLNILAAPLSLKQAVDVWGYPGNALAVMQRLKAQFDPANLLNPHRFIGGI